MPSVNVNGTSFEYTEQGQGDPLLLVHGSGSDYRTWHRQQESFAEHFRAIAYSRRYHWPNDPIPESADYSMTEHVDDLQAIFQALGVASAHLIGHSYGAFLCLLLAMREPELIRTLVLAEPPCVTLFVSSTPKPLELLKLLATRPRTAVAVMKFAATGIAPATRAAKQGDLQNAMRRFGSAVLGRDFYRRLSPSRLDQIRANAIKAEFLGSGFAPLNAGAIRRLQIPTLLITAQHSPRLFHRLTDTLEDLLPHAQRLEIPAASHIMHEDNPAAFNAAVLAFLAKQGEAGERGDMRSPRS